MRGTGQRRLPGSFVIPPLTSEDVDAFIRDGDFATPEDLRQIAADAIAVAASLRVAIRPPPRPQRKANAPSAYPNDLCIQRRSRREA